MTRAMGLITGKQAADDYWEQLLQQQSDDTGLSKYTTQKLVAELELRENYHIACQTKAIRLNLGLTMSEFGKKLVPIASKGNVCNWEKMRNLPNANRMKQIKKLAKDCSPR